MAWLICARSARLHVGNWITGKHVTNYLESCCLLQYRNWSDTRSLSKCLFCWTNDSLARSLSTGPMVNPSGFGGREGRTQITVTSTIMLMGRREGRKEGRKERASIEESKEDRQIPQQYVRSHVLDHLQMVACCTLWSDFPFHPVSFSTEYGFKI